MFDRFFALSLLIMSKITGKASYFVTRLKLFCSAKVGVAFGLTVLARDLLVQEEQAIQRGILHLLSRATLVQTFGQRFHVCLKEGSIVVPPYAPPSRMQSRFIPPSTPRSIFVYFRGLFYDPGNDPEGGYYSR